MPDPTVDHARVNRIIREMDQAMTEASEALRALTTAWATSEPYASLPPVRTIEEYQSALAARQAAFAKAEETLNIWLSPAQRKEWAADPADRSFTVIGNVTGKRYRIHNPLSPHNVDELDENGWRVARLCFVPVLQFPFAAYPAADVALMQKLMLEHNEAEVLRIADRAQLLFRLPSMGIGLVDQLTR